MRAFLETLVSGWTVRERRFRSMRFGGLFLGFSFFLTAALLLMAMLFQFNVRQERNRPFSPWVYRTSAAAALARAAPGAGR
jgi:hypothetical protein